MPPTSRLPDSRLDSLYGAEGFGGDKTMRAKVIRELIDEIRALRRELTEVRQQSRTSSGNR
jgi:ribosomal protein L19E